MKAKDPPKTRIFSNWAQRKYTGQAVQPKKAGIHPLEARAPHARAHPLSLNKPSPTGGCYLGQLVLASP
jgi:hypothetical protein